VGLEQSPLSLLSTIELLERKSSGSGLEIRSTAVGTRHADHVAPSIGGRSEGIFRLRTRATDFFYILVTDSGGL
jgi:hypothetical protein